MTQEKRPFHELPIVQRAGMLPNDPTFQKWVESPCKWNCGARNAVENASAYVRHICEIDSRRELNENPEAAKRFAALCTHYFAWKNSEQEASEGSQ